MSARAYSRLVALIVVVLFAFIGTMRAPHAPSAVMPAKHPASAASAAAASGGPALYPVIKVVDGDTIEVQEDGTIVKVRLIGIDTPEVVDPRKVVQCFGREASNEAHRMLDGQSVSLETDPSQDTHDKYGRLLAYAYLPDGTFFNEHMISAGFAHEYAYRFPYKYQKRFKAAEKAAREAQRGLWAPDTCAGDTKQPAR